MGLRLTRLTIESEKIHSIEAGETIELKTNPNEEVLQNYKVVSKKVELGDSGEKQCTLKVAPLEHYNEEVRE